MLKRNKRADDMIVLFRMEEMKPLKQYLATEIVKARKALLAANNMNEVIRCQERIRALKDVLHQGRKARRFFDRVKGNTP